MKNMLTFLVLDGFKDKLKGIFSIVEGYVSNIVGKLTDIISTHGETQHYVLYGCVLVLLVILLLAGLIAVFKKIPKLFVFIVFLLAAVVGLAFFASC